MHFRHALHQHVPRTTSLLRCGLDSFPEEMVVTARAVGVFIVRIKCGAGVVVSGVDRSGSRVNSYHAAMIERIKDAQNCSVTEVEVVISVGVILALTKDGADEVESASREGDTEPDTHAVVNNNTLEEEALETAVEEVEEPLLSGVGTMMEDVATSVRGLLIEVLFAVPRTPLNLGHAKALAVSETHVLGVALLVVGESASYCHEQKC